MNKVDTIMFAILTLGVIGLVTAPMNSFAAPICWDQEATIVGTAGDDVLYGHLVMT